MTIMMTMAAIEVLSGMFLLATENTGVRYITIRRIAKYAFAAVAFMSAVAIMVMEW